MRKPTLRLVNNKKQSAPPVANQPIDWMAKLKEKIAKERENNLTANAISEREENSFSGWDNRITCSRCSYLATNGQCLNSVAAGAMGKYHPMPNKPRRCQGFKAGGI
ncbi:MAG: hypothetical protein ACU4EQ_08235 [Candidatus Nitrosoglobus sp.]